MCPFQIFPLESADRPAVEALLDRVFGRDRGARSSYRLRAGNPPCPALSFAARMEGRLVGSVQQTRRGARRRPGRESGEPLGFGPAAAVGVRVGPRASHGAHPGARALLLGPLAVEPELRGRGIGRALLRRSLDAARAAGRPHVFLVGERNYYEPLGFGPAAAVGVRVAGEPADRVHHMALIPDIPAPRGELRAWRPQDGEGVCRGKRP